MKFKNFDLRMFEKAHIEAERSEYDRFRVGCVIAYKKHIIGSGRNGNKSNPMQKEYNRKYRHFNNTNGEYIHDAVHAEIAAIQSIPYTVGIEVDWSKVYIYVYRICPGKSNGYGNAKPCAACMAAIRELGIKNVYYTDDDGFSYLRLDN